MEPSFYHSIGYAYSFVNDYDKTFLNYNKAIELNPNIAELSLIYRNRGFAYSYLQDHQNAIEDFERAILFNNYLHLNFNHINGDTYFTMGSSYMNMGDFKEAIKYFNKAIEIDRNDHMAYYKKAIAHSMLEQHWDAIANFDKAI